MLNQTGLLLFQVSHRALFLAPCCCFVFLHNNDITSDIVSEIRFYADDCVCYREIKNKEDTLKLRKDIGRLGSWARKWGMRFQPVICIHVIFIQQFWDRQMHLPVLCQNAVEILFKGNSKNKHWFTISTKI